MKTAIRYIQMKQVEKLLRSTGKTQQEIAELVGVSQQTVSRYQSGKVKMSVDRFFEWCEKLGVKDYNMFK